MITIGSVLCDDYIKIVLTYLNVYDVQHILHDIVSICFSQNA